MPAKNTPIHANSFMMLSARLNGIYGVKKGIFFTAINIIAIAKNIIAPTITNLENS